MKSKICIILSFVFITDSIYSTDFIAITEIMYDSPFNEDVSITPHNFGEYIELYNAGENDVNIGGWRLQMINPAQTLVLPDSIIPAHSFLVIAYGTPNEYGVLDDYDCESSDDECYGNGWTDFHAIYQVSPDTCNVIFQTSLILPNNNHILLLKDLQGLTRDSVHYGYSPDSDTMFAPNNDASGFDIISSTLYSVRRNNIFFYLNGTCMEFDASNWVSYNEPGSQRNTVGWSQYSMNTNITMSPTTVEINNYMIEITPTTSQSNIVVHNVSQNIQNAITTAYYYDGLLREQYTIQKNITPGGKNLMNFKEYDSFNRISKHYLPIPTETSVANLDTYTATASQFYTGENRYFSEYIYSTELLEEGIINNALSSIQYPGRAWNGHSVSTQTFGNSENTIKLFVVTASGALQNKGYYVENALLGERTSDEDGKTSITYVNKNGYKVMERKGNGYDTYFVYNDFGQLSFVLPPALSSMLGMGTYDINNNYLKQYAYTYKYDSRKNCIYKRLPGCEPTIMIYDKAGNLVYSANGEQNKCGNPFIYMYDKLGRIAYVLENEVQECNYFYNDFYEAVTDTLAVEQCFNDYADLHPLEDTHYSESYITESEKLLLHNVCFYDDYTFLLYAVHQGGLEYDDSKEHLFGTKSDKTKGMLTGKRIYALDENNLYIETAYYYDYRGRVIQQRSTNHLGGYDAVYTAYDFSGQPTRRLYSSSIAGGPTTTEQYTYSYDHAGRLLSETYQLNNNTPTTLSDYRYDELGRLACKRLHNGIDSVNYSYNIRNTLTRIKAGSGFEENLYYEGQNPILDIGMPCYNGNISSSTWTYGNQTNGYYYFYDNLNRLSHEYSLLNGSFGDYAYTENYNYDSQGNITSLYRWNAADIMDGLVMEYNGNQLKAVSNDYQMIAPAYNAKHYQDLTDETTEMLYDQNGNLIVDLDRNICKIEYNSLNLPTRIQFSNGNQIQHLYDATGQKLLTTYFTRKSTTVVPVGNILQPENSISDYNVFEVAYNGNMTYKRYGRSAPWQQDFVHNHEGYYRFYSPEESYPFYYIKDHLDNIRETWIIPTADNKMCVQRMQYYPSGLPWDTNSGDTEQPYKYNGKEFIEMHGLDEYDSHARWYYPAIARTTTMDPLCEKYYDISPYAWCGNNFVNTIDPLGMDTINITYNKDNGKWDIGKTIIAKGDDIFILTDENGEISNYVFSEGEYGKRVSCLNIEDGGEEKHMLGVYHISGTKINGTGFYVTRGGEPNNTYNSYKRIIDKEYPILPPSKKALWQMPGVGGDVIERGIRFHYGKGIAYKNSKGCFVLFYNYTLLGDDISITLRDSQKAAWDFAHNLGGIGLVNYDADIRGEIKPRIGVSCFPFGISDKLVLKTAR